MGSRTWQDRDLEAVQLDKNGLFFREQTRNHTTGMFRHFCSPVNALILSSHRNPTLCELLPHQTLQFVCPLHLSNALNMNCFWKEMWREKMRTFSGVIQGCQHCIWLFTLLAFALHSRVSKADDALKGMMDFLKVENQQLGLIQWKGGEKIEARMWFTVRSTAGNESPHTNVCECSARLFCLSY